MKADEADTKKTGDMTNTRVRTPENENMPKIHTYRGITPPHAYSHGSLSTQR